MIESNLNEILNESDSFDELNDDLSCYDSEIEYPYWERDDDLLV